MENRETAGRLDILGNKIWNASRDELSGNEVFRCGIEQPDVPDGYKYKTLWNRRGGAIFPSPAAWGAVPAESDPGEQRVSAYGVPLYFPAHVEGVSVRGGVECTSVELKL